MPNDVVGSFLQAQAGTVAANRPVPPEATLRRGDDVLVRRSGRYSKTQARLVDVDAARILLSARRSRHKPFDFAANQSEQLTRDLSRRGA